MGVRICLKKSSAGVAGVDFSVAFHGVRLDTIPTELGSAGREAQQLDFRQNRARSRPRGAPAGRPGGQIPDSDQMTSPPAEL